MAVKLRYKKSVNELEIPGIYDEEVYVTSAGLGANRKGKLLQSDGSFIGLEWSEDSDILYNNPGRTTDLGNFATPYSRYAQTNISTTTRDMATKGGNRYSFVIQRNPNIPNTSTWGGVVIIPLKEMMRVRGARFRLSFNYRGYSGSYGMEVYQNFSVGWGSYGIGLPIPWSKGISAFDTDWKWEHYSHDFDISDAYLDWVPGSNQQAWNPSTAYSGSWYGVTHDGYVYRHVSGKVSTVGVTPDQEYAADRSKAWDLKWPMTPGYTNLYNQIKIGFNYQAQNARGTHVHIDNIRLTNITNGNAFRYDIDADSWFADTLTEKGVDLYAVGTAFVALPRTDNGIDRFAVEGNRYLSLNESEIYNTGGRGLRLAVFNQSGDVSFQQTYDVHSGGSNSDALATKLSSLNPEDLWCLTSNDAIGSESTHNTSPNLRNYLVSAGSRMWNPNDDALYLWSIDPIQVRNPYAAFGKGGRLIKEDGSSATDTVYKRKAVIQMRVS